MTPSYCSILESKKNKEYYYDDITTSRFIKIEKNIFDISQLIFSPSNYTTNFIAKHYGVSKEKLITIPFGVDLKNDKRSSNKRIKKSKVG